MHRECDRDFSGRKLVDRVKAQINKVLNVKTDASIYLYDRQMSIDIFSSVQIPMEAGIHHACSRPPGGEKRDASEKKIVTVTPASP
jgi:hypothetical protein